MDKPKTNKNKKNFRFKINEFLAVKEKLLQL
jgi:hypothetical protein